MECLVCGERQCPKCRECTGECCPMETCKCEEGEMPGPCLCGDPYCGSCGDPMLAEQEAAVEKLVETLMVDHQLMPDEMEFLVKVIPVLLEEIRKLRDNSARGAMESLTFQTSEMREHTQALEAELKRLRGQHRE